MKVQGGEGGDGGGNIYLETRRQLAGSRGSRASGSVGASVRLYTLGPLRGARLLLSRDPRPEPGRRRLRHRRLDRRRSDNLIENNISWTFNKVMVMRASGGRQRRRLQLLRGRLRGTATRPSPRVGFNASPHDDLALRALRGERRVQLRLRRRWGNSIYITVFRNHVTGLRRSLDGLGLSDAGRQQVRGRHGAALLVHLRRQRPREPGHEPDPGGTSFTSRTRPPMDDPAHLALGWDDGSPHPESDPKVKPTTLRDGNFDYVTNTVKWDTTAQTLPNSLYLTSKPAFFGSLTWPWVDPTRNDQDLHLARASSASRAEAPPRPACPLATTLGDGGQRRHHHRELHRHPVAGRHHLGDRELRHRQRHRHRGQRLRRPRRAPSPSPPDRPRRPSPSP